MTVGISRDLPGDKPKQNLYQEVNNANTILNLLIFRIINVTKVLHIQTTYAWKRYYSNVQTAT